MADKKAPRRSKEMDIAKLEAQRLPELRDVARELNISGFSTMKKQALIWFTSM